MRTVPFFAPDIDENEMDAVTEVLRSGWLTTGPVADRFEREFREYTHARHALAVSSGTAALHLALKALEVGPGDEVITTPMTFCSTVHAILQVGATPVLADIGPDLNVDSDAVAAAITPRTRAVLAVHMAGLPCEMDRLRALGLPVIADAAHAFGAAYKGVPIGGDEADATAFSFYANKTITTAEGGMLTTSSEQLARRGRLLRLHGIERRGSSWRYEVVSDGYKYNLPDVLAAIGVAQLAKAERMRCRRAEIAAAYTEAFRGTEQIDTAPERADTRHAWHLYVLRLNCAISRDEFINELERQGIGCSVHFRPIHMHRWFANKVRMPLGCESAEREFARILSLPLHPLMTDEDVDSVIQAVRCSVERLCCSAASTFS